VQILADDPRETADPGEIQAVPQLARQALRRARSAILWENSVIGTAEVRYFVQGLRQRRFDSTDCRTLPEAERCFEAMSGL
jgi:hypothetical protein